MTTQPPLTAEALRQALDRLKVVFEWGHQCASRGERISNVLAGMATEVGYIYKQLDLSSPAPAGPCQMCGGKGKIPAILSGETLGPAKDAERSEWAERHPITCPMCNGAPASAPQGTEGEFWTPFDKQIIGCAEEIATRHMVLKTSRYPKEGLDALFAEIEALGAVVRQRDDYVDDKEGLLDYAASAATGSAQAADGEGGGRVVPDSATITGSTAEGTTISPDARIPGTARNAEAAVESGPSPSSPSSAPAPLPCPFDCDDQGGDPVVESAGGGFQVFCNACNASGPMESTENAAIAAWNRRAAPPSSAPDEIEGLAKEWGDYKELVGPGARVTDIGDRMAAALATLREERDAAQADALNYSKAYGDAMERSGKHTVDIMALEADRDRLAEQLRAAQEQWDGWNKAAGVILRESDIQKSTNDYLRESLTPYKAVAETAQRLNDDSGLQAVAGWYPSLQKVRAALASLPTADTAKGGE